MRFPHRLRVRYVECDRQGHVFNGHYLTWFDMSHTDMLRRLGLDYEQLLAGGTDFVVAEATVRFRAAAHFDDELDVVAIPQPPGNTSLRTEFEVLRGEEVLAEGHLLHVCVDAQTLAKKSWPDELRSALAT
jgi:acyl-CoA thioester hydrolase